MSFIYLNESSEFQPQKFACLLVLPEIACKTLVVSFTPFSVNYIGQYCFDLKEIPSIHWLCPANLLTRIATRWLRILSTK